MDLEIIKYLNKTCSDQLNFELKFKNKKPQYLKTFILHIQVSGLHATLKRRHEALKLVHGE